jgi:RND superfamily putative drug exporter
MMWPERQPSQCPAEPRAAIFLPDAHQTVGEGVTLSYSPERFNLIGAESQRTVNHDYAVVFPAAALIILIILALLLRSLVAP